jgi:hypothetical protein
LRGPAAKPRRGLFYCRAETRGPAPALQDLEATHPRLPMQPLRPRQPPLAGLLMENRNEHSQATNGLLRRSACCLCRSVPVPRMSKKEPGVSRVAWRLRGEWGHKKPRQEHDRPSGGAVPGRATKDQGAAPSDAKRSIPVHQLVGNKRQRLALESAPNGDADGPPFVSRAPGRECRSRSCGAGGSCLASVFRRADASRCGTRRGVRKEGRRR